MRSRTLVLVLTLAVVIAAALHWRKPRPLFETNLTAEPSKSYSLLIDNERFPIKIEAPQRLHLEVLPATGAAGENISQQRTVIPQSDDQAGMSKVTEPRFRFYFDSAKTLANYRRTEKLDQLLKASDLETIKAVVHWAHGQFPPGRPRNYPTQDALTLLPMLRSGQEQGFCAQYCYVLVQALQALGFKSRYVSLKNHEVAEAWLVSSKKWIVIDPTNDALYTDEKGHLLSALEVSRLKKSVKIQTTVTLEDPQQLLSMFESLSYWLRNDLVSHPINIYDLRKYRVRALLTPEDSLNFRPGDLATAYPDELYFDPTL